MKNFKKFALLLILPVIIAGCSSTPAKKSYILTAEASPVVANTGYKMPSLMISQVRTVGQLSTDMFYSRSPNEIESFTLSDWAAPPANLIQSAITQDLDARNLFQFVIMAPNNIATAYRLDMSILQMRQYFNDNQQSHIILNMQARLINNSTNKIVKTFTFRESEPSLTYNAEGGVKAYNIALNRIANQLAADLTNTLRSAR